MAEQQVQIQTIVQGENPNSISLAAVRLLAQHNLSNGNLETTGNFTNDKMGKPQCLTIAFAVAPTVTYKI